MTPRRKDARALSHAKPRAGSLTRTATMDRHVEARAFGLNTKRSTLQECDELKQIARSLASTDAMRCDAMR